LRKIWMSKVWDSKSPNFGEIMPLDVALLENHIIYYREGSDASSQKLQAM
jgi:hypothetical protein